LDLAFNCQSPDMLLKASPSRRILGAIVLMPLELMASSDYNYCSSAFTIHCDHLVVIRYVLTPSNGEGAHRAAAGKYARDEISIETLVIMNGKR